MAEFTLKPREEETLKLTIGDESFQIPLGNSLNPEYLASLDTKEKTIEFFNQYIPKKIAKTLRYIDYDDITQAWLDATQKSYGGNPGES